MSELTIITNNHKREIVYYWELTQAEKEEFDWIKDNENDYTFFRYKGSTYCLSEFMRIENHSNADFMAWDGYSSDSFFSGILVKYLDVETFDDGFIIAGWYMS